ncbi:CoA transferase [Methylobacterium terricola]|uniref:CoA transferase n=2 Tax=Methylobacterium terricola TaxID=2583531 RepID=A0A5C4L9V3_9HYPH|nr:CoA transferase [Methylobacterium terricola]TNC07709.1 CoA transferase [Methylobacterium terricola]
MAFDETRDAGSAPLSGVRILDFTRMLAGPFCTAMLADAGAEVIKVENPKGGDDARHFAPRIGTESAFFLLINRGKKSITVDMKTEEGKVLIRDLACRCDVVIENFKPGVAAKLGIDHESLRTINPGLIHVSISGYGQAGPLAHRPAYDIIAQAVGGIMGVNGHAGLPPTRVGESIGDITAGLYAAWGISAALHRRARTGQGERIDVAMVDSIFSLLVTGLSQFLYAGEVPGPIGNAHPISAPLDSFRAADGMLIIAVANDALFAKLCAAIGRSDLISDPRFLTDPDRKRNDRALKDIIEAWSGTFSVQAAVALLDEAGIPASPVLTLDAVVASDHARHRELVRTVTHPTLGDIRLVPQPVRFEETPAQPLAPPPLLGEHTEPVLREILALDASRIDALRAKRVV